MYDALGQEDSGLVCSIVPTLPRPPLLLGAPLLSAYRKHEAALCAATVTARAFKGIHVIRDRGKSKSALCRTSSDSAVDSLQVADMLWAGLPVITLPGPTKPSRVAAAIASAAGCAVGVARTLSEYVALTVAIVKVVGNSTSDNDAVHSPVPNSAVAASASPVHSSAQRARGLLLASQEAMSDEVPLERRSARDATPPHYTAGSSDAGDGNASGMAGNDHVDRDSAGAPPLKRLHHVDRDSSGGRCHADWRVMDGRIFASRCAMGYYTKSNFYICRSKIFYD